MILFFLVFGVSTGYYWGFSNERSVLERKLNIIHPLRESNLSYKFIDPLLAYIIPSADQQSEFASLKSQITKVINTAKTDNSLSYGSVFFYDLNRGRWIGVNQDHQYNPASMLKVVIMVAYFREAENNPGILDKNLVYTSSINDLLSKDSFKSPSELKINKSYKISDLIDRMIVDSDNGAEHVLLNNISQTSLDSIYTTLDIGSPDAVKGDYTISPRDFSFFFRVLYSGTYLSYEYSEKSLDILSKTTFRDGLVSGVPSSITIAHKYGEYAVEQDNQLVQIELHDCGIVYYPKYPYLLCIMTKGNNLSDLKSTIKNISSLIYNNYSNLK